MVVYLKIGLLEAWIIFILLLVVFIPAFTLIYSPSSIPQEYECECPTPQCPECVCPQCPECPECPQPSKLAGYVIIPPLGLNGWFEGNYFLGEIQYYTYIYPVEGFKYILLINLPKDRLMYAEWIDWDTMEVGWVDFQEYNSTHSYAYVTEIRMQFNIFGSYTRYEVWHYREVFLLHVFIVTEDTTVYEILG
jgi:hypothetical protein